ncbi:hypothetical protein SNEBB_001270 [Seison nebaliae]|nr:hypothetical protein SNEBB_001270 [Seison nebaliae]
MTGINVKEGQFTTVIYSLIKEFKYSDAVDILNDQLVVLGGENIAALSLVGYCYFQLEDYISASDAYEKLFELRPTEEIYLLHHCHCLYKLGHYENAFEKVKKVRDPKLEKEMIKLKTAIKFHEKELQEAKEYLNDLPENDSDVSINSGCIVFENENYDEALKLFENGMKLTGFRTDVAYNIALCYYKKRDYKNSLSQLTKIIEKGVTDHPELNIGLITDGMDSASVGNTAVLRESKLVEAFNLKAAIEYELENFKDAREAFTDMPPRNIEELDPITLHNIGITNVDEESEESLDKLEHLLQIADSPKEVFQNLLIIYLKFELYDMAGDVCANNPELEKECLTPAFQKYFDAIITKQTSQEDAYVKLERIAKGYFEDLRNVTNEVKTAKSRRRNEVSNIAAARYDQVIKQYIPILMAQAKIYWDAKNYAVVEKLFKNSLEFCNDHEKWKLNVAHLCYMMGDKKYKDAGIFYENILEKHKKNILKVEPIALANLCICYIMMTQNERAEDLMKLIEKEEEKANYEVSGDVKKHHLCIVNLAVGTLYCAKGNYQFGISRVMKSLEPYVKRLAPETWFYAKKCFLALLENMAKQAISVSDTFLEELFYFFRQIEIHGVKIKANNEVQQGTLLSGVNSITYEARRLRLLLTKLLDC